MNNTVRYYVHQEMRYLTIRFASSSVDEETTCTKRMSLVEEISQVMEEEKPTAANVSLDQKV